VNVFRGSIAVPWVTSALWHATQTMLAVHLTM